MELIVDGYNLIGAEQGLGGVLERKRNWLLQRLSDYQRIKQIHVTVVFDGWRSGSGQETAQKHNGLLVVFSAIGEKADGVIIRLTRGKAAGTVVISSDREIRTAVERFGAVAVSSEDFGDILRRLESSYDEGEESEPDENTRAKFASKAERRRREVLKRLRV